MKLKISENVVLNWQKSVKISSPESNHEKVMEE